MSASQSMVARMALAWTEFGSIRSALWASSRARGIVVVFERQARQQFLRFDQMRVGFQRFRRQFGGSSTEVLGRDQRHAQKRAGVIRLDLESLLEQVVRNVGLPVIQIEPAPGDADSRGSPDYL